jgi:hypothetical protein
LLIVCSSCQTTIKVPPEAVGKQGKCPKCGTVLTIPAEPPPAATVEPPAPETGYASEIQPPFPSPPPPVPKSSRHYDVVDDEPPRRRYEDEEDDDDDWRSIRRPRRRQSIAMSMAAMVLGISGLVVFVASIAVTIGFTAVAGPGGCCCSFFGGYGALVICAILGILGVVFGFIGIGQGGRGFGWAGIITSITTLVLGAAFFALIGIAVANQPPPPNFNNPQPNFNPPPRVAPPPRQK